MAVCTEVSNVSGLRSSRPGRWLGLPLGRNLYAKRPPGADLISSDPAPAQGTRPRPYTFVTDRTPQRWLFMDIETISVANKWTIFRILYKQNS